MKSQAAAFTAALSLVTLACAGSAIARPSVAPTTQIANSSTTGTPTAITYKISVGANKSSAAIPIPANVPVTVTWYSNTPGTRNVGEMNIISVPNAFLDWTGHSDTSSGYTPEAGYSGTAGAHIMYVDFGENSDFEVNNSTSFRIVGNSDATTGVVTVVVTY